jgi:hypothetical protein
MQGCNKVQQKTERDKLIEYGRGVFVSVHQGPLPVNHIANAGSNWS